MDTQTIFTASDIEGLGVFFGIDAPADVLTLYRRVPALRRAINIRLKDLAAVPVEVEGEIPFSVKDLIRRMELDYLLYGAAYQLRVIRGGQWVGMQRLHPSTIKVEYLSTGGTPELRFKQVTETGTFGPWPESEVFYIWADNPYSAIVHGPAPFEAAATAAQSLYIIDQITQSYFGNNGMPLTVMEIHDLGNLQKTKFERTVKRATASIRRAFSLIVTEGRVATHSIAPKLADLALDQLAREARRSIALAFDVPPSELEYDAVNYATAKQYRKTYLERVIAARAAFYEERLNRWLTPYKAHVRIDVNALASFQEDEAERAQAVLALASAGFGALDAARILGFDIPEEIAKKYDMTGVVTGEDNTNDGSRDRRSGADQAGSGQVMGGAVPAKANAFGETAPEKIALEKHIEFTNDIRKWRMKALRRGRSKGNFAASFKSDVIPEPLNAAIFAALKEAKTPDEVKAIFTSATRLP